MLLPGVMAEERSRSLTSFSFTSETTDKFAGTNGTALTSHTDDQGNAWAVWPYDTAAPAVFDLDGAGNAIVPYGNVAFNSAALNALVPPTPDYTVSASFKVVSNSSYSVQLFARAASGAATAYYFIIGTNVSPTMALAKLVGGSNTWLATGSFSWGSGETHTLSLTVNGTAITASIDGVVVMTATDSSISAAGQAGIGSYANSNVLTGNFEVAQYSSIPNARIQANAAIAANHGKFADTTDYWSAAPAYTYPFIADMWYAFHASPGSFTAAQIQNIIDKVIAAKKGSSGSGFLAGDFPIALDNSAGGAQYFWSGLDGLHNNVTGDGALFLPMMARLAYEKTLSTTNFSTDAAALKQALDNIPLDGTTHLVNVAGGSEWIPFGFQDNVKKNGNDLMGSLLYWKACTDMAFLYTAAGDSTNAGIMTARASAIKASLGTGSALWDAGDGMYLAATGNNNQIDVIGSAYALYLGVADSGQSAAISSYLVTNYGSLVDANGYIRESPSNWAVSWSGGHGSGNYDDGYWSWGHEYVIAALAYTSPATAATLIATFVGASTPLQEYDNSGGTPAAQNLCSPMGVLISL